MERDGELAAFVAVLDAAAAARGSAVVVEGAAGTGKSRLLGALRDEARERGFRVLGARGSHSELDLAFGVAHQLLGPLLADAADPALRRGIPGSRPTPGLLHGLFELVRLAAAREPLLLIVDDLLLADDASQRALAFVAHRLAAQPIVLGVAARSFELDAGSPAAEVASDPDALRLRPAALSRPAVATAIAAMLGAAADPTFADACHELTAGHTGRLAALLRDLAAEGVAPSAGAVGRVFAVAPPELATAVAPAPVDRAGAAARALTDARELALAGDVGPAARVLQQAADQIGDADPRPSFMLEADLALLSRAGLHVRRRDSQRLRELGRSLPRDDHAARLLMATLAFDAALRGEPASSAGTMAEVAWANGRLLVDEGPQSPAVLAVAAVLVLTERDAVADGALAAITAEARRGGSPAAEAVALCLRAHADLVRGEQAAAERHAREALHASSAPGAGAAHAAAAACLAIVRGCLHGAGEEAEAVLAAALLTAPAAGAPGMDAVLLARGRLRLRAGHPAEALPDLLECGRRLEARNVRNPAVLRWRSFAAEGLARSQQGTRARELVLEEIELARAFGAPRTLALVLCHAGVVLRGEEGTALLRESSELAARHIEGPTRAHVVLELGAALRRAGLRIEAREHLQRAAELAEQAGLRTMVARAREELIAAGARPRRAHASGPGALTAQERRAAELAASGWGNRRIAQELFVTLKTVEMHLTHAYRKLAISSRAQLADALSGGEAGVPGAVDRTVA